MGNIVMIIHVPTLVVLAMLPLHSVVEDDDDDNEFFDSSEIENEDDYIETDASTFDSLLVFIYEISSNLYLIFTFRQNFYTMRNVNKIIRRTNCSTYS